MKAEHFLYIRLSQEKKRTGAGELTIGELAEFAGDPEACRSAAQTVVQRVEGEETKDYLIRFTDVVEALRKAQPHLIPLSVGSEETVVRYEPQPRPSHPVIERLKVGLICLILFVGSFMAIMTFHTDASVPDLFAQIHRLITGEVQERPVILILSYSVGIAVGMLGFFNHIGPKKLTPDPTPVQVEFAQYRKQIDDCLIDSLEQEAE
jgi:stage V sporulation protein AA